MVRAIGASSENSATVHLHFKKLVKYVKLKIDSGSQRSSNKSVGEPQGLKRKGPPIM